MSLVDDEGNQVVCEFRVLENVLFEARGVSHLGTRKHDTVLIASDVLTVFLEFRKAVAREVRTLSMSARCSVFPVTAIAGIPFDLNAAACSSSRATSGLITMITFLKFSVRLSGIQR